MYQIERQANTEYATGMWGKTKSARRGKVSMADREAAVAGHEAGNRIRLRKEIH